jgi:hypothetical protein
VDALIAAVVSAVTSVTIAILSLQFASRQQRRGTERSEQKEINSRYLNPLRFQVADNHHRLWFVLSQDRARGRTLSIEEPEDLSSKDWTWFNGEGSFLASSLYTMSCLFGQIQKVREEIPYLRLSSADDTRLVELILKLQITLVRQGGIQYVVQTSIGQDMWLQEEQRLRTYREFCELLRDPESRVWLDRMIEFHLAAGRDEKRNRTITAISSMQALAEFLDQCVGGGNAIESRWAAEGRSPEVLKTIDYS